MDVRSGYVVAIFRDPRRRLLSAYNYHKHSFGMNSWVLLGDSMDGGRWYSGGISSLFFFIPRDERKRMLQTTHTLEAFANFPGIASCQTKMIIGYTCATYVRLSDANVYEAKRRMDRDFALVGLLEHWNASVCLFHRMLGKGRGRA